MQKEGNPVFLTQPPGVIVGPQDGPYNPFLNIMLAAIHPENPREAITVEEAVTPYTYGFAYAKLKKNKRGTLPVGKLADIAVPSHEIFNVPLLQLPATSSVLTIMDGKIVFKAL